MLKYSYLLKMLYSQLKGKNTTLIFPVNLNFGLMLLMTLRKKGMSSYKKGAQRFLRNQDWSQITLRIKHERYGIVVNLFWALRLFPIWFLIVSILCITIQLTITIKFSWMPLVKMMSSSKLLCVFVHTLLWF